MLAQRFMRPYYAILATLLFTTLIAQCILTYSEGRSLFNTFSYFTIQSNVLVLVTSALLALRPDLNTTWWRILRLAALTGITVTGIVYIFLLSKYVHLTGIGLLYNYVFHYVMPIASVVGFFVFESRHNFRRSDLSFMAWPVLWLIYTYVRAIFFDPKFTGFTTVPSRYPYEFLDISRVPMTEVLSSIAFVALLIAAVGIGYIYSDQRKKLPPQLPEKEADEATERSKDTV